MHDNIQPAPGEVERHCAPKAPARARHECLTIHPFRNHQYHVYDI